MWSCLMFVVSEVIVSDIEFFVVVVKNVINYM